MTAPRRILVTGGAGFLGGHVVDRLLERGHQVVVLDRVGDVHRTDVDLVVGDVCDAATTGRLVAETDGVIHLAAILGTSETVDQPHGAVSANLIGAVNVFEAVRANARPVVQITVGNHFMNNPYAITKSAAEKLAFFYNARHGTRIAVVRGLNAYGERQKAAPVRKIIPNFVLPALGDGELVVFGDGEQKMDMIYVGDLAEILVRALLVEHGVYDRAFEAGTGVAPSVRDIAARVLAAVPGSRARVKHVPMRAGEPERSRVVADPTTLAPLGIEVGSLRTLDEGLVPTVAYYRGTLASASNA